MKFICNLFFLSITSCLFGQQKETVNVDVIPPSPNAASLLEYANIPVNYYTGTPEIEVPLYTLKGRHLEVPVSLSYHASGIKVDDIASWTGLGWTLNAGGVITREVLGLPDEDEEGYCGTNQRGLRANSPVDASYLNNIRYEEWDAEPDLFFFNFMGRTGRFVINADGDPIMLPYQSLKIEPAIGPNASNNYWVITDENGVKYFFGQTLASREETTAAAHTTGYCLEQPDVKEFVSSWYLDRIENYGESIDFTYNQGSDFTYRIKSDIDVHYDSGPFTAGCDASVFTCYQDYTDITIEKPKYIASITSVLGTVSFSSSAGRSDYSALRKLDKIEARNLDSNKLIKSLDFDYSYFSPSCSSTDCKRLKLTGITNSTSSEYVYRAFEYYEDQNLPPRNSYKIDHWGYYNNNTVNNLIPTVSGIYSGASRNPHLSRSRANSLKKIILPTEGYQQISYQLHEYIKNSTLKNAGGLRVSKIDEYSKVGATPIATEFSYVKENSSSSGLIFKEPIYHHYFNHFLWMTGPGINQSCGSIGYAIYSHSLNERFDLTGNHIGYSRVVVNLPHGGEKILEYSNYEIDGGRYDDIYDPDDYFERIYNAPIDPHGPPFAMPSESKFWARGLLLSEMDKDDLGNTLSEKSNDYLEFETSGISDAKGIKTVLFDYQTDVIVDGSGNTLSAQSHGDNMTGIYTYSSKGIRLDYSERYKYDQYGNEKTYSKVDYTYSNVEPNFVKTETTTHPDGSRNKSEYVYPFDLVAPAGSWLTYALAIQRLNYVHDIARPIESIYSYAKPGGSFKVTGAQLNKYKMFYGTGNDDLGTIGEAFPETIYSLEINSPLSPGSFTESSIEEVSSNAYDLAYDSRYEPKTVIGYDDYGNISSVIASDGVSKQYTWSHNHSLVTASIENPGGNNEQRTDYAHIPLVGVSSIKDPNDRFTYYEYDSRNRLHLIRDHENNIIERYRYNYANVNDLSGIITIEGDLAENSVQTISTNTVGNTSYKWYNSDFSNVLSTEQSFTHTFNGAGTKTINLVLTNPEYDAPTTLSATKTFYTCDLSLSSFNMFDHYGGSQFLAVSTSAPEFTYSEDISWITVTKQGGGLMIECESNSSSVRLGSLTITDSYGCEVQLSISQQAYSSNPTCPPGCVWDSVDQQCEGAGGLPCAQ